MAEPKRLTDAERKKLEDKIAKQARYAANRLGAAGCMIIAFIPDESGRFYHMVDGGQTPLPPDEVYLHFMQMHQTKVLKAAQNQEKPNGV